MALLVVFTAAMISAPSFACETDAQCSAPTTCQFAAGLSRGECRSPATPAIVAGEKSRRAPLAQRKLGDVCQFTVDCGYGMYCYKVPAAAEGKCFQPAK